MSRQWAGEAIGRLPPNQTMSLDVVLPLRDQAGLDVSEELYDPDQPLLPAFPHRAGVHRDGLVPARQTMTPWFSFAQANGFTVVGGSRDGMDVQIKGPVSAVETPSM